MPWSDANTEGMSLGKITILQVFGFLGEIIITLIKRWYILKPWQQKSSLPVLSGKCISWMNWLRLALCKISKSSQNLHLSTYFSSARIFLAKLQGRRGGRGVIWFSRSFFDFVQMNYTKIGFQTGVPHSSGLTRHHVQEFLIWHARTSVVQNNRGVE